MVTCVCMRVCIYIQKHIHVLYFSVSGSGRLAGLCTGRIAANVTVLSWGQCRECQHFPAHGLAPEHFPCQCPENIQYFLSLLSPGH